MRPIARSLRPWGLLLAVALGACDGGATDGPSNAGASQDSGADSGFEVGAGESDSGGADSSGDSGSGADGSASPETGTTQDGSATQDAAQDDAVDSAGDSADASLQDTSSADAVGPTSCIPNKNFCFADQIWGCNVKGEPTQIKQVCPAETYCAVDAGVAVCAAKPSEDAGSEPDSDTAEADAADAAVGDDAGEDADASDAGNPDAGGAAADSDDASDADISDADASDADSGYTGPTSCTANKLFCWDNNVWYCSASGKPTTVKTLCGSLQCQVANGVAQCLADAPDAGADSAADVLDTLDAADTADVADIVDVKDTADVPDGDGYVFPTICDGNKQFCYDNKIWYCTNGKPTTVKLVCNAPATCELVSGVPNCVQPSDASGSDVQDVPDVQDIADVKDTADVQDIADVKDTSDVPDIADSVGDGGPTSCDTNKQFCFDNKIWYCSNSKPTTVNKTCAAGTTCQIVSGVPACVAQSDASGDTSADTISDTLSDTQAGCTANVAFCSGGNVWGCSAMSKPTGMISDCTSFGWSCQVVGGVAKCVAPVDASGDGDSGPAKTCTSNQTFCDGGLIRYCNANGTWGSVKTTCGSGQVCGIQGGAPVCILGSYACSGDQCTCTPAEPDTCGKITKTGTTLGYVYGVTKRISCYGEPSVSECAEFNSCQSGQCTSSVSDATSQYWNYSCDMPQFLTYKTALPVDCRCLTHQALESGLAPCKRPYELKNAGASIGSGPSFATLQQVSVQGGFVDSKTDEIVSAVAWSGSTDRKGLIVAVEVKTGNRRVISGQYQLAGSPATKGSGPNLMWPLDVQPGPGGKLLAINDSASAAPEILAIDPATGNRTLLWRGGDAAFGQCASPDAGKFIQTNALGFAVDTDGSMLIGYSNALVDGRGVARISADGKTCKIVSGSGSKNGAIDKGTGNALGGFVQGFAIQSGQLWGLTTQPKALWSIDLATGNRTQVFTAASATVMGERRLGWDAARKLWWISGVQNSTTISAFDPATKILSNVDSSCGADKLFKLCWAGPININTLNYGGLYVHPSNGRMYFGQDQLSMVEVEPETGNSRVLSL